MFRTNDRPILSSERAPHMERTVTFKQEYTSISWDRDGAQHLDRQTDLCSFDFDSDYPSSLSENMYAYPHTWIHCIEVCEELHDHFLVQTPRED
jgi:hypothetical protein